LEKLESQADAKGYVYILVKQICEPGDCFYLDEILTHKEAKYRIKTQFPSTVCSCSVFDLRKQIFPVFENIDSQKLIDFTNTIDDYDLDNPYEKLRYDRELYTLTNQKEFNKDGGFFRNFKEYDCLQPEPQKQFDLYVQNLLWSIMKVHIS
jgi:hypothetical protein